MSFRYEEAIEICDMVIQMDENFAEAYEIKGKFNLKFISFLGRILAALFRPEEAIE